MKEDKIKIIDGIEYVPKYLYDRDTTRLRESRDNKNMMLTRSQEENRSLIGKLNYYKLNKISGSSPKWISVEEGLPELTDKVYFVMLRWGSSDNPYYIPRLASYKGDGTWRSVSRRHKELDVYYWFPQPRFTGNHRALGYNDMSDQFPPIDD